MQDRRQAVSNDDLMQELEMGSAETRAKEDEQEIPSIPGLDVNPDLVAPIRCAQWLLTTIGYIPSIQAFMSVNPQKHEAIFISPCTSSPGMNNC